MFKKIFLLFFVAVNFFILNGVYAARIKDLAFLRGGRPNQLVGFSLVIGLNGTGDSAESLLTRVPLVNALERLGVTISAGDVRGRSVAAVMVTANLPPYAKAGQKIDVVASAIGDAITLKGGVLVMTPLRAANNEIYAVSQGALTDIPSGVELPESLTLTGSQPLALDPYQNYLPTVGRVVNGALVEKSIDFDFNLRTHLYLHLLTPDFTTAYRIAEAINKELGILSAKAQDAAAIEISIPKSYLNQVVELIAKIEVLEVLDDTTAKVVIDEHSGMVVVGENVVVNPVAISYNNLNLVIRDEIVGAPNAYVLDPQPEDNNQLAPNLPIDINQINRQSDIAKERSNLLMFNGGANLKEIVAGLNRIGVSNRDLIEILKNIKTAGAINAELIFR